MTARGEPVRADDTPEALHKRLEAYRVQTAPLIAFYADKGTLRTVDGMAGIADVAEAIDQILAPAQQSPASEQRAAERRSSSR
jgi:adenylate kinase